MIKIVHILGKFDRGGVEMLLKEVYLNTNKELYDISFILLSDDKGVFDDELILNGATLYKIPIRNGILSFFINLYMLFIKVKFDVVHSHHQSFSGIILMIAYFSGIKGRIAHSHNDEVFFEKKASFMRKLYVKLMRKLIIVFSNKRLACSKKAGISLYKEDFIVVKNGVSLNKFSKYSQDKRLQYFKDFGIDINCKVIGHVGRFDDQKNHNFIIDIMDFISKKNEEVILVLVGVGDLLPVIKKKVKKNNLQNKVLFLEGRNDIPDIMTNFFDIFLFPSLYEGLGIVLLESQISGLFNVVSENIVDEAIIFNELVLRLNLEDGAEFWADCILQNIYKKNTENKYLETFKDSDNTIEATINNLNEIYNKIIKK